MQLRLAWTITERKEKEGRRCEGGEIHSARGFRAQLIISPYGNVQMCAKHSSLKTWTFLRHCCTAFALCLSLQSCLKDASQQSQPTKLGVWVFLSLLSLLIPCRCPTALVGHHSRQKSYVVWNFLFISCFYMKCHSLSMQRLILQAEIVRFPARFLLAPPLKCNISTITF